MTRPLPLLSLATLLVASPLAGLAETYRGHDRNRPLPPVVTPAVPSTEEKVGRAPSDAIILFDGTSTAAWVGWDTKPIPWVIQDGALVAVPNGDAIRTVEAFGACQVHIEFATPNPPTGERQDRGNSGFHFGFDRYEVQILDSYQNTTYADGSCASIYNQFPPDVNASRPPGAWQTYDIIWTPPRFDGEGVLLSPAYLTLFHNGVLVHYHRELIGQTGWIHRQPYTAHPEKLPFLIQYHGNSVRFRNMWVRPLDDSPREIFLADWELDKYVGEYENNFRIVREGDQLVVKEHGNRCRLYPSSRTRFFGKEVDVEVTFGEQREWLSLSVGGEPGARHKRL